LFVSFLLSVKCEAEWNKWTPKHIHAGNLCLHHTTLSPKHHQMKSNKKSPCSAGADFPEWKLFLDFSYIGCLQSLCSFDYIELNIIPFFYGFESFAGDCGKMTKDIVTILLFNKSKPLCVVEPFYFSFSHFPGLSLHFYFTRLQQRALIDVTTQLKMARLQVCLLILSRQMRGIP
jgi:hypothetical protein